MCKSLFLRKLLAQPSTLLKSDSGTDVFLWNFAKFLRTSFFMEHLWWLFLHFWLLRTLQFNYLKAVLNTYCHLRTKTIPIQTRDLYIKWGSSLKEKGTYVFVVLVELVMYTHLAIECSRWLWLTTHKFCSADIYAFSQLTIKVVIMLLW